MSKISDEAWDYPDCIWPPGIGRKIKISDRLQRALDEVDAKREAAALAFAQERHGDQLDKAGKPYIEHLRRVARRLRERWPEAPHEQVVAAILHDTLEDTGATQAELAARFLPCVADIVAAVSRPPGMPYLAWIRSTAATGDQGAIRVKLADLADNTDPARPDFPGRDRLVLERYAPAAAILEAALR